MADLTETRPKRLSWRKTLLYSLLPLVVLMVGAEALARTIEWFVPPLPVDYGLGFNPDSRVFEPHPDKRGWVRTVPAKTEFTFNRLSFQDPKPEGELRVAVFGGSNVAFLQQQFEDMMHPFPRLYPGLTLNIINCGAQAYGSERVLRVFEEAIQYDLDLVILYLGHNEFEDIVQRQLVNLDSLPLQRALYTSAAARLIRDTWARATQRRIETQVNDIRAAAAAAGEPSYLEAGIGPQEREQRMQLYEDNLRRMIALARERGADVAIGTLATNYWEPDFRWEAAQHYDELNQLYAVQQFEEGIELAKRVLAENTRFQASDVENKIIRRLAADEQVRLIDIEEAITTLEPNGVMGETYLYDECHLTEEGRLVWMERFMLPIHRAVESAGLAKSLVPDNLGS